MAFAKRIYNEWYDYFNQKWIVEIHDESGETAATFIGGADPLNFRFGPSGDLESIVKSTECTVTIIEQQGDDYSWLVTDDDRKIKLIVKVYPTAGGTTTSSTNNSIGTGNTFFSVATGLAMVAGDVIEAAYDSENVMFGTVNSYNPATGGLSMAVTSVIGSGIYESWVLTYQCSTYIDFYTGWLLANQYMDNLGYVNTISVIFSDQLSLLGNKLYLTGSVGPTGLETILNQVAKALEATGLQLNINIAVNIFQESMSVGGANDPFYQASVDQSIWLDEQYHPGDCLTVIEELLRPFWCRIFQARNEWWICRMRDLEYDNVLYRKFDYQGTYISNGILTPKISTSTSLNKFTPYLQRIGGERTYLPEWKQRDLEIDYGLRQSLIEGLNVDYNWIDYITHRRWLNDGGVWRYRTNGAYGHIMADTDGRTSFDGSKFLRSPGFPIVAGQTYNFNVFCGRNNTAFTIGFIPIKNKCEVFIWLYDPISMVTYSYDDTKDEGEKWIADPFSKVQGITFPEIASDIPGKYVKQETIAIEAPPVNGTCTISFFAPYRAFGSLVDTIYYLGDVSFERSDLTESLPNGKIERISINENAYTTPDPLRIRVNGGAAIVDEGPNAGSDINTDRYFGLISNAVLGDWTDNWEEIYGQYPFPSSIGNKLYDWILWHWAKQHMEISQSYEGSFIGLADMYSVIKVTEFDGKLFLWNDVEYAVKSGIWSGNLIELKHNSLKVGYTFDYDLYARSLPLGGNVYVPSSTGGMTTVPGGSSPQLQANIEGEFEGIAITWENNRLMKGDLPLIEYRRQTETTGAGEYQLTWDEPFESGDVYSVDPVIWGKNVDGIPIPGVPYDLDQDGFKINFGEVVTFTATALIER